MLFQEDLFQIVKAQVSEKWFYTYFKNDSGKLPRIDMLNLLSKYVGYENWHAFKETNSKKSVNKRLNKKALYLILPLVVIIGLYLGKARKHEFAFCFVDAMNNQAITKSLLDIQILKDDESPLYLKSDSLGCFNYASRASYIKFVVKSPYYKTDTIIRHIDSNRNRVVQLSTDDYALMLRYYTSGNVKDWRAHKEKLSKLIAEDALIYQILGDNIGIEVYTKEEFIRLVTIPTDNLKTLEILDRTITNEKIVKLKFIIK